MKEKSNEINIKMVKGNWERRCEMAATKRAEAKERKVLKKSGKVVNPESILQKLHKDVTLRETEAIVDVYVADPEGGMMCCAHFRTADCRMKRCRLMHDDNVSVAHLRNLPSIGGLLCGKEEEGCRPPPAPAAAVVDSLFSSVPEKRCLPPSPIDEIMPLEDWSALMFVAVDGECVYDYLTPEVWNNWIVKHRGAAAVARTPGCLSTVHEGTGDDDNDDSDEEEGEGEILNAAQSTTVPTTQSTTALITLCNGKSRQGGLVEQCPPALAVLLSYLSVVDVVCGVSLACKSLKTCVLRDEGFRIRRCLCLYATPNYDATTCNSLSIYIPTTHPYLTTEMLPSFRREALALLSHDLSKRKKDDKRKRAKSSNVKKTDKKDGFARGSGGR